LALRDGKLCFMAVAWSLLPDAAFDDLVARILYVWPSSPSPTTSASTYGFCVAASTRRPRKTRR
jgi:hypothetical protein